MAHYAMAIDLNRCVNCKACNGACKMVNGVDIGYFWTWVDRKMADTLTTETGTPSHDFYYLPMQCQHCEHPECVEVCPTGASKKLDDGTVQIDPDACIGCQACIPACPYGIRYLNEEKAIVEKCTLCHDRIVDGELPQCVINCVGMAKWFGDLDEGIENFKGHDGVTMGETIKPYEESDVHHLANSGNDPSFVYILRNHTWID